MLALCLSAKDYKVTAKDYKVTNIETVVNAERDSVLVKNHALCPVTLKAGTKYDCYSLLTADGLPQVLHL